MRAVARSRKPRRKSRAELGALAFRRARRVGAFVASVVALGAFGCSSGTEEVARAFSAPLVLGGVRYEPAQLRHGADLYGAYCRPCHGVNGDGLGPSAAGLNPPPRDLRLGLFKFAAVAAGQLPTDADLRRTLQRGLAGSAMKASDIPDSELDALIGYLKTFSPRWREEKPGDPFVPSPDPWRERPLEAIARGGLVYHGLAQCAVACHPAYLPRAKIREAAASVSHMQLTQFRADLFEPVPKPSDYGYAILPPDFTFHRLRTGTERDSLYRVIAAGVGGTAMPTWRGVLPEADLWALTYYVQSLTNLRDTPAAEALRAALLASEKDATSGR